MILTRSATTALLSLCAAAGCAAQAAVPTPPAAQAASAPAAGHGDLKRTVIEDDAVRIEETRLRGQAQRITVQSKVGGTRPYEIVVGPGGRDPSQDRGAVGQRTWSIFSF
jgi:hypothetical protein